MMIIEIILTFISAIAIIIVIGIIHTTYKIHIIKRKIKIKSMEMSKDLVTKPLKYFTKKIKKKLK
jgi:predicted Holliday junction resolvase-like endonuclease